jgi:hypothetical protein
VGREKNSTLFLFLFGTSGTPLEWPIRGFSLSLLSVSCLLPHLPVPSTSLSSSPSLSRFPSLCSLTRFLLHFSSRSILYSPFLPSYHLFIHLLIIFFFSSTFSFRLRTPAHPPAPFFFRTLSSTFESFNSRTVLSHLLSMRFVTRQPLHDRRLLILDTVTSFHGRTRNPGPLL